MNQSPFQEEQRRLVTVVSRLKQYWQNLKEIPKYHGKDLVEQALDDQRERRSKRLEIALQEPYFGRLDFQEENMDTFRSLYIGKAGVQDEESHQPLVVDWRAPVASMFYSFTGNTERASYRSPEGEIAGVVHMKRNISIRQQVLQRVVDSYVRGEDSLGVADEFLLYKLGENKDNRLRDIVSTIQSEQDQIIRADLDKVLIIQGVPGSGKTTVALHRLAFLLYQYQNSITPEKMIIFAPNKMFLDYISDVLPELGVEDIQQTTFASWGMEVLSGEGLLQPADAKNRSSEQLIGMRYKGSKDFFYLVHAALERYVVSCIPDKAFLLWEDTSISVETMRDWFSNEYRHYPIAKRKERIIARIKRWIDTEHKEYREHDPKGKQRQKALNRLRSYAKSWAPICPRQRYIAVLEAAVLREDMHALYLRDSIKKIKRKEIDTADLAPLLYIYYYLHGTSSQDQFEHIVIDEAQDFSPFQLGVLKMVGRGVSFTILGDLLQNIHQQGIDHWSEFREIFDSGITEYYQLNTSYRSTSEIIHFANAIISPYKKDVSLAVPVFRSGTPVKIVSYRSERIQEITKKIHDLLREKANTIAVVTRDEEGSRRVYQLLLDRGVSVHLITSDQTEYYGGITVTSISLTKGMEFDAVLLLDVDDMNYPVDELSAKLLYVGCTRALHHLYLFHTKDHPSGVIASISKELYV